MKLKHWIAFWRPQEELVASFGEARLIRRENGGYELRGGSADDRVQAKEWASLFLHDACPAIVRRARRAGCSPMASSEGLAGYQRVTITEHNSSGGRDSG